LEIYQDQRGALIHRERGQRGRDIHGQVGAVGRVLGDRQVATRAVFVVLLLGQRHRAPNALAAGPVQTGINDDAV
jgi:hypothetical protein